jgi:hypothetical protein
MAFDIYDYYFDPSALLGLSHLHTCRFPQASETSSRAIH